MNKGIVFYTDNLLDHNIADRVQKQLLFIKNKLNIPIISVSLKPMRFGDKNITLALERGYLTMFKQMLCGLENSDADVIFFCEHDVLYHLSHFDFIPQQNNIYYYNLNVWKLDIKTGKTVRVDDCKQISGLCANRDLLLAHYKERVKRVETGGFSREMGFEPGTHGRKEKIDDYKAEGWSSEFPNIDIRHKGNLTHTRWNPEQFKNKRFTKGWIETNGKYIPGWEGLNLI